MSRGNPNQKKAVAELKEMGYSVKVKRNQIHVFGNNQSPFNPTHKAQDGETYGMTIAEAKEFIKQAITPVAATLKCEYCEYSYGVRSNGDFDIYRPDGTYHSTHFSTGASADEIKAGRCPVGHGELVKIER